MTVPDFQTLMLPILQHLADGEEHPRKEIALAISDHFVLSDEDRAATVASGGTVINSRTWWALTHMSQAGLLTRTKRGIFILSESGREVVDTPPDKVTMAFLMKYPSYAEFRRRKGTKKKQSTKVSVPGPATSDASPQDLLDQAVDENRAAVSSELLDRVRSIDPTAFERLVLHLLGSMGYGTSGSQEHTGQSGDAGIDGIISQDPLGLDRIYLQAKRYAAENVVQRPAIQSFVGALIGAQGDRGVFITASSFSRGAEQEAAKVNMRIELIDGQRLADLMIRFGVGVQADSEVTLYRTDEDFFEAL